MAKPDKIDANDKNPRPRIRKPALKKADAGARSDVPAVEKAFDILELLSAAPQGLTMNEMATTLNRSMGEIYRIGVYMGKRGYVVQDPESSRYALTLRLFELAHQNSPTNRLVRQALPIMESLALQCEQSCHLAVLYDASVLVLASAPSPRPACYSVKSGAVFPLLETSSGLVILAHMKPEARERAISGLGIDERDGALANVQTIHRKGFDRRNSNMVHGILNLSVPIFDHAGVVGALTMAYLNQVHQKTTPDESLAALQASAQRLSTLLGHPT
ncbi:MAG: IclR family transcriptional regulator [Burkholderiaceae bacterium]